MAEKVRVGIIGAGRWADLVLAPGVQAHPQADLVAVCRRTKGSAEEFAAKFGATQVFTDYRDLVRLDGLDAVVVATPNATHYETCLAAFEQGLHVFCEKPIAMTTAQAKELWLAADAAGVKNMVSFTARFLPHARYVKRLLDRHWCGRLFHFNLNKQAGYGGIDTPFKWRWDREQAGGGVLADLGSHGLDLARWLVGDIKRVCATLPTFIRERPDVRTGELREVNVDDAAAILVEFENGVQGVLHISWVAHKGRTQTVELCGEDGALIFDSNPEGWEMGLRGSRRGDEKRVELPVPPELWEGIDDSTPERGFRSFIEDYPGPTRRFLDVILGDEPSAPSFYDGMKAQELIEAAQISDRERRWVELPLAG
ncbi:MAG: hypothetical protein COZ06_33925 [Armatimonadetes bacterium CG_4_10_14_3_um_filter_66_18]|nr:Gfo/Idh/MocA family oxidoreductase [Armatimonadota bacterium]OIP11766.1 MAG: hypothetical protein AUJ96_01770 [Armatimonadetes bacterium CG2_30_66_41]PIU93989.1 MAG: hypothetical protein COS65_09975 [Armatimonadetes bacterium CG06_land_8_20_14_3_00_66_21]PIX49016.1 MAG: hypothetical protein COZ57_04400 [Armatimonadetes bacterium CG_4_8_14_3_um_filter_66_20]PIY36935.1 MAG: hypothetical protein COZ06_33925 [Armatimonadetes bacterium CG_4_10_14_3_um_filter_66_18]PIZ32158.1 MAG: hypothetical pr